MHLSIFLSIHLFLSISFYFHLSDSLTVWLLTKLSVYLSSVYLSIGLSVYRSFCLSHIFLVYLLSVYLYVYLSVCLSIYLSLYLSTYLSIFLSVYLSICLSLRSNYVRILPKVEVGRSKTKQLCEIFFKNGKMGAELTASHRCVLQFLHPIRPKERACREKNEATARITQNYLSGAENLMLHSTTSLKKSLLWRPSMSGGDVSCIASATQHASFQIPFKRPTPAKPSRFPQCFKVQNSLRLPYKIQTWCAFGMFTSKCARAASVCIFWRSQLSDRTLAFWHILSSKCVSRHNGVHFSIIKTSSLVQYPSIKWGGLGSG